jgi:hypothetical protein
LLVAEVRNQSQAIKWGHIVLLGQGLHVAVVQLEGESFGRKIRQGVTRTGDVFHILVFFHCSDSVLVSSLFNWEHWWHANCFLPPFPGRVVVADSKDGSADD